MINELRFSISSLLLQLKNVLDDLSDEQFCSPIPFLSNATIGEHVRHIIEFYIELNKGYETGIIDYNGRKRDHLLQTSRATALSKFNEVIDGIYKENIVLNIYTDYSSSHESKLQLHTNYFRELMYNVEHTVHHMALIRVAIYNTADIVVPEDFGVAASTLKFRKQQCAQ